MMHCLHLSETLGEEHTRLIYLYKTLHDFQKNTSQKFLYGSVLTSHWPKLSPMTTGLQREK